MPKKFSHKYVEDYYKNYGFTLKSIYSSCIRRDTVLCPKGHSINITFNNFKKTHCCHVCFNNGKHSVKYVEDYYKNYGYFIKSEYKNSDVKDDLICPKGHSIRMSFHSFRTGCRCYECFGSKKHTQEYIYNYYLSHGYNLKSEYKGSKNKDVLVCNNGHEIEMKFNNFKTGYRCPLCFFERNSGSNNKKWNTDRTRLLRIGILYFDKRKIKKLINDPLYNEYNINKNKYHIDHIFPRVAFIDNDLDLKYDKKIIKEICNLEENLRIIPKEENLSKSGKYNQDEFMNWFNEKIKNYV